MDALARVTALGLVGFDPVGALLVLGALAAGARRRSLTVLVGGYLVTITVFGVAASLLVRVGLTAWDLSRYLPSARVLSWIEIGAGVLVIGLSAYVARRSRRPRPPEPPREVRLSTGALAGAGALLALSLAIDPGFVLVVGYTATLPVAGVTPLLLYWGVLSQIAMIVLYAGALLDGSGRAVGVLRSAFESGRRWLRHHGAWLVLLLGLAIVVDGVHRLLLLPDP